MTQTLTNPMTALRTLVANSASFRTLVGAADATAALAYIHRVGVDPDANKSLAGLRPFALVAYHVPLDLDDEAQFGGDGNTYVDKGKLGLWFQVDVASGDASDHEDAEISFLNTIGDIVAEMEALAGRDEYLNITLLRGSDGPTRSSRQEKTLTEDYYQIGFDVEWGP